VVLPILFGKALNQTFSPGIFFLATTYFINEKSSYRQTENFIDKIVRDQEIQIGP
jgi:hypothetical protein